MLTNRVFDIVVVGGGIAGSIVAGVLARAGRGVLVVEREARYRDRVRGEVTHPWGVNEAQLLDLGDLLIHAGSQKIPIFQEYAGREARPPFAWAEISVNEQPMMGFSHPGFQQEAISWAGRQGATVARPAKAIGFRSGRQPAVTIVENGHETEVRAALIVGADGRESMARRWTGGQIERDPEHHRIGGGLFSNVALASHVFHEAGQQGGGVWAFERSEGCCRIYIVASGDVMATTGLDGSPDAFLSFAAAVMPEDLFTNARQAGPVAFFSNAETWATRVAGEGVVLIGDAAGSSDPSRGHGTSLVFRDVRLLAGLLEEHQHVQPAIQEFERKRRVYFETIREITRWLAALLFETGNEALRRRERHEKAKQNDSTLGGLRMLEAQGPDGMVVDEAARRIYFGEDLP